MKGTLLLALIICLGNLRLAVAQSRTLVKTINHSFLVDKNATIALTNKYGQVTIDTWDKDAVKVAVKITAYGKNNTDLERSMTRVDVEFDNYKDLLTIETVLDRNSNTFKELWNNIGDYSKHLISKNKIRIDYTLKIPKYCKIELNNKFGNVYIYQSTTDLKVDLAHGDFKTNELLGSNKIAVSFGKARIKKATHAIFNLKNAELTLRDGGDIIIESSTSILSLDKIQSLKLNSRNDKIEIEEIKALKGKATFTNMYIDSVLDMIDLTLTYGECKFSNISSNFSQLAIKSRSTDLDINFQMGAYFSANLTGLENKIFLTKNFMGMDRSINEEVKDLITLTGTLGHVKSKLSHVNINCESGEMHLSLEETGAMTNNK